MKKLVFSLLFLPILLSGQINESKVDSLKFKADLSLTGFWQSGNVETKIFRAKSGLSFIPWKNWVFKTQNSYVFQEAGGAHDTLYDYIVIQEELRPNISELYESVYIDKYSDLVLWKRKNFKVLSIIEI